MNDVLKNVIKVQIQKLKNISFHNFINELYLKCYGNDFIPIKQKKDKGCDGILFNNTSLSIYSPDQYRYQVFKNKIKDDYNKYSQNHSNQYQNWQVVFNGEWTAEMKIFVSGLKFSAQTIGIENILELIENLNWSKLKKIASYLKINDDFFIYNVLDMVINDMMGEEKLRNTTINNSESPIYIRDKIKLNFSEGDIANAIDEYEDCVLYFRAINDIIKSYDDEDKSALKNKIRHEYNFICQNCRDFKNSLDILTREFSIKNINDDLYRLYVRVVLIYFFEQCLIGERTEVEKNVNSSYRK